MEAPYDPSHALRCVGLESALLDPFSRTVHAAAAAEALMGVEFDCMVQVRPHTRGVQLTIPWV